ncbi:tail fiber protein [Neotamlana laminarinivorans]|uniref:Tail fiber protein n=1 Tax=Neotamlana laminarinivorans TaxID=2883124 RepID=A0A9X1HWM2_9FLAO|nr:tail fiber protein [Tamlana laminarinivorans]MCB4797215.1 tail fiber protein [Tamlana laminarinivorans]
MKLKITQTVLTILVPFLISAQNTFPDNGNVGIGTTNPATLFALQGTDESISVANTVYNYSTTHKIGAQFGSWSEHGTAGIKFHRWLGSNTNYDCAYVGQSKYSYNYGLDFRTDRLSTFSDATTSRMFISSITGYIGIGTTTPSVSLDIDSGNLYLGSGASNNGNRSELRVYGFDNSESFYGSIHSNYNDYKRTFDISSNAMVNQIKIDASANNSGNIILTPGDNGYVGIGTISPDSPLTVKGLIHAQEVKVTATAGADFVFDNDYHLRSLKNLELFIKEYKHLPEIPSAKEMQINGMLVAEISTKLLQKIEELTLYTIEQEKRIKELETENKTLKTNTIRIEALEQKLNLIIQKSN